MATQEERKSETRQRLLDAAADLFASKGIDAVSVDAVAQAADRTSGAVYAHFGSKQGLWMALMSRWGRELAAQILSDMENEPEVTERLRSVADRLVVHPSKHTRQLLKLEHELTRLAWRDPEAAAMVRQRARESQRFLARGLARWIAEGLIETSLTPDALAAVLRALISGLALQNSVDPGSIGIDTATAALGATLGVPRVIPNLVTSRR